MRIGIVTFFRPYGGALQCFALQKVLRSLGHDVTVVNRPWGKFRPAPNPSFVKRLKESILGSIFRDPFAEFYRKYYRFTKIITSAEDLKELGTSKYFDVMISGSDQPWNPQCIKTMGYYFYLDWVSHDVRKYAYAVSFGKDYFPASDEQIGKIKTILNTYEAISVRESSGITISKDLFDINPELCIDPTLLLRSDDYETIIKDKRITKPYVCQFFLDLNQEKLKFIRNIAEIEGIPIIDNNLIEPASNIGRRIFRKRSISQWLRNIRDAKYVVTDSFHGTVFSILFHKQFICVSNKKRGTTRFESLLTITSQNKRLLDEQNLDADKADLLLKEYIDYNQIDLAIGEIRQKSMDFIRNIK